MAKVKTRTPLRISLVGGGTDYPWFFRQHGGLVISFAIDQYVYLGNSTNGTRTGLGVSSAKSVAVTAADICAGTRISHPSTIAAEAIRKESRIHGEDTTGWQDIVISAFGGLKAIHFNQDLSFNVTAITQSVDKCLLLFSLDMPGVSTSDMAVTLKRDNRETTPILRDILAQAETFRNDILNQPMCTSRLGAYLDEYWGLKKRLATSVSNPRIDAIYQRALDAGATGGKVCGSGGGGHMLICCEPEKHDAVIAALPECKHIPFKIDYEGVRRIA